MPTFAPVIKNDGAIAQLVEQRTENPCVPGSIPGGTTSKKSHCFNESVTLFFVDTTHPTASYRRRHFSPIQWLNPKLASSTSQPAPASNSMDQPIMTSQMLQIP